MLGKNLIRLILGCGAVFIVVGGIQMLLLKTTRFGTSVPINRGSSGGSMVVHGPLSSVPLVASQGDDAPLVLGEDITLDAILTDSEQTATVVQSESSPTMTDSGSQLSTAEAETLECRRVAAELEKEVDVLRERISELDTAHREACVRPQYRPLFSKEDDLSASQIADIRRQRAEAEKARMNRKHQLANDLRTEWGRLREVKRDLSILKRNADGEAVRRVLAKY